METELRQQKQALLEENARYDADLEGLRGEVAKIELEEKDYWDAIALSERKLVETERESSKIDNFLFRIEEEKKRAESLNLLGDLFRISFDGNVGSINGFRLGCPPGVKASPKDVNGAMGQAVMLLSLISKKFRFTSEQNELVPMGFYSQIKDQSGALGLYMSEGLPRFNTGLKWLLDYVAALCAHICKELNVTEEVVAGFQ